MNSRIAYIMLAFTVLALGVPAVARDNGQWANSPANIREWFESLRQPDHPRISCCGEADAFEADNFEVEGDHYVAIITNGKGVIENGTRITVPNAKMKFDRGNPTGHGIIFIGDRGQIIATSRPAERKRAAWRALEHDPEKLKIFRIGSCATSRRLERHPILI